MKEILLTINSNYEQHLPFVSWAYKKNNWQAIRLENLTKSIFPETKRSICE